ncbi:hypothetical protein cyc_08962 [Cyclospora cayetanensis]|uniref:Uncharacterized protein n=1 Tax=Cyclospora cayetanensis TaxID=88456 RepID=A0A1D3CZT2_9EIME|nr:hypothetical protein cyc_08962 [Cyclospora cayetanensis]
MTSSEASSPFSFSTSTDAGTAAPSTSVSPPLSLPSAVAAATSPAGAAAAEGSEKGTAWYYVLSGPEGSLLSVVVSPRDGAEAIRLRMHVRHESLAETLDEGLKVRLLPFPASDGAATEASLATVSAATAAQDGYACLKAVRRLTRAPYFFSWTDTPATARNPTAAAPKTRLLQAREGDKAADALSVKCSPNCLAALLLLGTTSSPLGPQTQLLLVTLLPPSEQQQQTKAMATQLLLAPVHRELLLSRRRPDTPSPLAPASSDAAESRSKFGSKSTGSNSSNASKSPWSAIDAKEFVGWCAVSCGGGSETMRLTQTSVRNTPSVAFAPTGAAPAGAKAGALTEEERVLHGLQSRVPWILLFGGQWRDAVGRWFFNTEVFALMPVPLDSLHAAEASSEPPLSSAANSTVALLLTPRKNASSAAKPPTATAEDTATPLLDVQTVQLNITGPRPEARIG